MTLSTRLPCTCGAWDQHIDSIDLGDLVHRDASDITQRRSGPRDFSATKLLKEKRSKFLQLFSTFRVQHLAHIIGRKLWHLLQQTGFQLFIDPGFMHHFLKLHTWSLVLQEYYVRHEDTSIISLRYIIYKHIYIRYIKYKAPPAQVVSYVFLLALNTALNLLVQGLLCYFSWLTTWLSILYFHVHPSRSQVVVAKKTCPMPTQSTSTAGKQSWVGTSAKLEVFFLLWDDEWPALALCRQQSSMHVSRA